MNMIMIVFVLQVNEESLTMILQLIITRNRNRLLYFNFIKVKLFSLRTYNLKGEHSRVKGKK